MKFNLPVIALILFITSCKPAIKPADLYGTWKYLKVENPNETPPDSVGHNELVAQAPFIKFTKSDSLIINWGGKVLSHGKFNVTGNNINYTEILPDNTTRAFPFYISKIDGKNLVFETLGEHGTRVTAVKE
ncbi:hypothetical protein [Mucilaginibacter sp.]